MRHRISIAWGITFFFGAWLAGPVRAFDLGADFDLLGQVREGDQSRETEAPANLYGRVGARGIGALRSVDTFFRLEQDLANGDGRADFYAGYAVISGAVPSVDAILGRQFFSEAPGFVYVADGGKITVDRGWPVTLSVYGGVPQYFEPTYSTNVISQDENLWGGTIRSKRWRGGQVSAGFQQWERSGHILQRQVSATGTQSLPHLPVPTDLYSSIAYDADGNNIDSARGGANFYLGRPRLLVNLEGSYYKPQDGGKRLEVDLDKREDTIFQGFSVSELGQFHAGLTYPIFRTVSLNGGYSYQSYDSLKGEHVNGHLGDAGLTWTPGGDGLEVVGVTYYVADSDGGNVNGGSVHYLNQVYERIAFLVRFGATYYDKKSNQQDTPISSFVALTYDLLPNLSCQLNFEANSNVRFDQDFRFGFLVDYKFRHQFQGLPPTGGTS